MTTGRMSTRRAVALSAIVNIGTSVFGATAGIMIARALGPGDRGNLAAVMAWFAIGLVVGELGQSAAVTFWASKDPSRRSQFVASARLLMLVLGIVICVVGFACSDLLGGGNPDLVMAYRVVFLGCLANAAGAPVVYALQALSIPKWNVVRAVQPVIYLCIISGFFIWGRLTLVSAALASLISFIGQLVIAWLVGRSLGLRSWKPSREESIELAKYGSRYATSAVPATIVGQYDRVFLSWTVSAAQLGYYAVAMTLAQLSRPFATAISSVIFPVVSGHRGEETSRVQLERRTLLSVGTVTLVALVLIALIGAPLVPWVFGDAFAPAAPIVWALIPMFLFRSLNDAIAVLLRGRQLPGRAAASQLLVLFVGGLSLVLLAPTLGLIAAPAGLGIAEMIGLVANFVLLGRARRQGIHSGQELESPG